MDIKGYRKLIVIMTYMLLVAGMALGVVKYHYDSLQGVAEVATAMATGLASFMYGNAQEHKAEAMSTTAQVKS